MPEPSPTAPRQRALVRLALGPDVAIGLSAALGLLLISGAVHLFFGAFAAAAASVGAIVVTPPDQPAARRGKFWQLLPAALVGTPLFFAVQWLHADPLALAALVVPASFVAFLGAAWGKRGLPVSIAVMFAMVFSMAVPAAPGAGHALATTGWFALGAAAYLVYATLANALLNARYRRLVLADALFAMARLMRSQARQFAADVTTGSAGPNRWIGLLLQQQAALADQLQATRNIVLESPRTPQRQRRAAMLLQLLDLRDHLLACELDLDTLRASPGQHPVLTALRRELELLAEDVDALADALQRDRPPPPHADRRAASPVIATDAPPAAPGTGTDAGTMTPSAARLAAALVDRVGHIHDEVARLGALARGETLPDQAVVHAHWRLFISPTTWSWRPFLGLWRWDAPPLRHAIRAALAIATGEAVAMALPWGTHDYWILLTIVVVLRGSLAQTLERRNSRVAGTLLGCLIAGALLAAHTPAFLLLFVVTAAQGVAHAFAIRRYLVTAVAATVLALLQAHLLGAGGSLAFEVAERLADTLIGTAIAWAFSYVLPSWERGQLPALVARTLAAQAQHARVALGLGQLVAVDDEAELAWRLARREVYDSLSALVQSTQRALAEPRAVRPPLEPLSRLLAHSYQLLAQLTAVKTMLLLRRDRLDPLMIRNPLRQATQAIAGALVSSAATTATDPTGPPTGASAGAAIGAESDALHGLVAAADLATPDLNAWLVRRLGLATDLATHLQADAQQVLQAVGPRKER